MTGTQQGLEMTSNAPLAPNPIQYRLIDGEQPQSASLIPCPMESTKVEEPAQANGSEYESRDRPLGRTRDASSSLLVASEYRRVAKLDGRVALPLGTSGHSGGP